MQSYCGLNASQQIFAKIFILWGRLTFKKILYIITSVFLHPFSSYISTSCVKDSFRKTKEDPPTVDVCYEGLYLHWRRFSFIFE